MWDMVNGMFESTGCLFVFLHVRRILKDKTVKGVSIPATIYFVLWGIWNLAYYPHLEQWISFVGSSSIALMNSVWVVLLIYYSRKEKGPKYENIC